MNEEQKPATVSFSRAKQTLAAAPPPNPSTAVVPAAAPGALTTPGNPAEDGPNVGEWDSVRLNRPPALKLFTVKAPTYLDNKEWVDTFVWDSAVSLGKACVVIPTKQTLMYKEKRADGDKNPTPPSMFKTKAEAEESGLDYVALSCAEILIECSDAVAAMAPVQTHLTTLAGKNYLPAVIWLQGTAFRIARTWYSDFGKWLKSRYANGQYRLYATRETGTHGPYMAAQCKAHGATPQEIRDAIAAEFKI